ncbi:hypothetical protein HNP32_002579 [Brevundimonas bullata]|uniref:Spore coat protein U domain-containing protein n=1 Tax=Brevundimonas bullata TaxID=13160 RepID=A0A7W7IRS0_9CAUL|nr:hypothetical protein [Brevundimonas bullata]MBB4798825.1 hypothetical protein [Brevundimonas bullata]MBB6383785.1 hypothetical protein [Brevundimonas bullata]
MVSTLSKSFAAVAALGLLALIPGQASAQDKCNLTIQPALDQWVIRYNPLEDEIAQRTFDVLLVNSGRTPCNGNILASLQAEAFGLTTPGGANRVRYTLVDVDYGGVDITPRSGESARRNGTSVSIKQGEQLPARITFAAFPEAGVAQGRYTQVANLFVEQANGTIHATRPVTLVLDLAAAAAIGLKGEFSRPNGTPVIDLGELTEGPRPLNTALYVHSTGGYRVSVTSANRGRLRQGATAWYVDYNLKVGAQDINLQRTDTINVVSQTARRDDYPLTVRIGDVSGKRAGEYSDTLTFTVAAI